MTPDAPLADPPAAVAVAPAPPSSPPPEQTPLADPPAAVAVAPLPGVPRPTGGDAPGGRWRPTRAGLVNVWRYWDETFTFHDGRLLLRGPNGSGKSMALELLLPFLLDGDATPSKLTSGTRSRGGLYERVMTGTTDASRTGFAWVEFRRGAAVFTVGVRLKASAATRKVDHDFFTTTLAVGGGLDLLDEHREPLSRRRLGEAIGGTGAVHHTAVDHRAAVRTALFPGFSADRYDSVITALLALRKEKLSQNLDLDKLSAVLSEALPPLDEHDVAVVAEGFERLDRRRSELAALEAELDEVKALAARQRDYARAVTAALAGEVRAAETRRDDVTRAEREATTALEAVRAERATLGAEAGAVDEALDTADAETEALKDSDAYRKGAQLTDLRADARQRADTAARDRETAAARDADREAAEGRRAEAAEEHGDAAANEELARTDLRRAAGAVGAEPVADEAVAAGADEGENLLRAWARAQRQRIGEVRAALDRHRRATEQRGYAEEAVSGAEEVAEERVAARRRAEAAHHAALADYAAAVGSWSASCHAIGTDRLTAALPDPPTDPQAVAEAVAGLARHLAAEHAVARRNLAAAREELETEQAALEDSRAALASGRITEPAGPDWRTDRAGRDGAPLWRLVDLAPDTAAADVDGIEAALTSAGLLDAWVAPDGTVSLPDGDADVFLTAISREADDDDPAAAATTTPTDNLPAAATTTPTDNLPAAATTTLADNLAARPTTTLADVLVALDDTPVPAPVVARLLGTIPLLPSAADTGRSVALGRDGTFRLGPAAGRGSLRPAEWLGAEARERRRLARLAEIDAALAAGADRLADLDRQLAALLATEAAVAGDLAAQPDPAPVADARELLTRASARLDEAETHLARARDALGRAEEAVRAALRTLMTLAAQHQLPSTTEELAEVDTAIAAVETAAGTWARRRRDRGATERALHRAVADADQAAARAVEAAAHCAEAERAAAEVATRLATLESSLGAAYQELVDRLKAVDAHRQSLRRRKQELAEDQPTLDRQIGILETRQAQAETARQEAEAFRLRTHQRFTEVLADGFADDAGLTAPPPLDGVSAVLAAARSLAAELDGAPTDDHALDRLSNRVEERLHHARSTLGGRIDLTREQAEGGWWLLRASTSGVRRRASDLATGLAAELAAGRAELAADEEALFEQTLAGSVRQALAGRIRLANHLVDTINVQLGAVRSRAGDVGVRLRWEVDPTQPDVVRSARALLLRDPAGLSESERASLQAFVRARIDEARANLEATASWEARLRETLDYRAWHHFALQVNHRDWGDFQPATPKRLARLSTGERSVVLHLPMLASIAAHYTADDGTPAGCPRLILLDELFAGVDVANRAQLFGTFSAWNLDAVFTSDHEWCQYATLDGIAIHHLHPAAGDDPVTSTRFTWDGTQRVLSEPAA